MLAPHRPEFRLVHTDDRSAIYLHWHQIGLVLLAGFSIAIVDFNEFNGIPIGTIGIGFWLNLAVHLSIIYIAWQARERAHEMMMRGRDEDVTPFEDRVAKFYPYFVMLVSFATWILVNILAGFRQFELLEDGAHYVTMALLIMAPAMDTIVRGLVKHLVPPMTGEGVVAEQAYYATKRSYIRIGRVIVFAIVVALMANVWGY